MAVNIDSYGTSRTYNNGHLVHGLDYDANYDGDYLNLAMQNKNGNSIYLKMNNHELQQLFNLPSHERSLHERINNDFHSSKKLYSPTSKKTTKSRKTTKSKKTTRSKKKTRSKSSRKKTYTKSIDKTFY